MMFISPEDRDAYEAEALKQRIEFQQSQLETQDALREMLSNMSAPDLVTLRRIFHAISQYEANPLANFFEGQAHAILVHVHDVCPRCGVNHADEAVEEILGNKQCMTELDQSTDKGMESS